MIECWAAPLGDCGDEPSKEHLISAALWPGSKLLVTGFNWCRGNWKEVGGDSVTARILCKKHNNALSALDVAAGRAFADLRQAIVLVNERLSSRPPWPVVVLKITEPWLLERWFLKTMLKLVTVRPDDLRWRNPDAPVAEIPPRLLEISFGRPPFRKPMGLYSAQALGEPVGLSESVRFAPLRYEGETLVGGIFELAGWRVILHLEPHELPDGIPLPNEHDQRTYATQLQYRLSGINCNIGSILSHTIQFDWDGPPAL